MVLADPHSAMTDSETGSPREVSSAINGGTPIARWMVFVFFYQGHSSKVDDLFGGTPYDSGNLHVLPIILRFGWMDFPASHRRDETRG